MTKNSRSLICAGVAVLSWSTVATMFKIALSCFSPFEMLLVSAATATLIFAAVLTFQHKWQGVLVELRRKWMRYLLTGLLNPVAYYLVLFGAYDLLPAQVAQPINYLWPIFLLILLSVATKTTIPLVKYCGMLLSLGGVCLISLGGGGGGLSVNTFGVLLALGSAMLWALYWMVNRTNIADRIVSLFLGFACGTVLLLLCVPFVGFGDISIRGVLSSMYIGIFEMAIPFMLFGYAIQHTSRPVLVNQLCYLSPFLSLFIIHAVLGEHIYPSTYAGLALIIGGVVFNEFVAENWVKGRKNR